MGCRHETDAQLILARCSCETDVVSDHRCLDECILTKPQRSIDEVHLLAEERGSTLEVVVARMKRNANTTRFIAVSATVPNIEDVGVWLGPGELPSNTEPQRDAMRNRPMARVRSYLEYVRRLAD